MRLIVGRVQSEVDTVIVVPEKEDTTPIGVFQALPFANNKVYVMASFGSLVSPRLFVKGGKVCVLAAVPKLYVIS
jgi:hypothetical protein